MKIEGKKVEPPEYTRGAIARTYKYMASAYPRFRLSSQQEKLMAAWDKMYPPDQWECVRARRIAELQGNMSGIIEARCKEAGL